jgi:hypothetical protein
MTVTVKDIINFLSKYDDTTEVMLDLKNWDDLNVSSKTEAIQKVIIPVRMSKNLTYLFIQNQVLV